MQEKFVLYDYFVFYSGACGSVVVKALFYKPEGCGFETRWVNDFYQVT
jgi:hypothetical protein